MQPPRPARARVAYLVSQYPAISHTFIEREIGALRAEGVEVTTYTIRPCPERDLTSQTMREEAARTRALIGSSWATWIRAHLTLILSSPTAYLGVFARALRTGRAWPKDRLWQVFYFAEAVLLHDLLARAGIHHIHAHMTNVASDVSRLAVDIGRRLDGADAGWGWSVTIHGPDDFWMVEQWDVAAKLRDATAVSCISDFCRSQVMRLIPTSDWGKLSKVRMSVDASVYVPPPDGRRRPAGEPLRILYVGRLVPQKGGPVLLDALGQLRERGVATTTRVLGSGPIREDLERTARARSVDAVFTGAVGQDEILAHYHWADVFVLPSFQEGLPVVLMEAMATGLPVVSTRITGIPELVEDGRDGVLVLAGRADLLADAIAGLAGDPARRERLGRAARDAVLAEFTPVTTGPAMASFLREAGAFAAR